MATFTDASMMSAEEDSTSSPDDDPYDDTDILNSAGTDEVTAHLAAAGIFDCLIISTAIASMSSTAFAYPKMIQTVGFFF